MCGNHGVNHDKDESDMSDDDKFEFGKKLRVICDKMNVPCEKFNELNFLYEAKTNETWSVFPESFQEERLEYLNSLSLSDFQLVYTHGDINPDNIIIDNKKDAWLIDFADAMLALIECEYALIASQIFCFEKP
jgi:thiamine kinase-like enzyme